MENQSLDILLLEGLQVSPHLSIPVFILILLVYIFIMLSNVGLAILIMMERSLHEPMYLLFWNMTINDALGTTATVPRLLSDMFVPATERYIHYIYCVIQAFCTHLNASASHTIFMVMAFDRYVAICSPLRYTTIMTGAMVVKLSVAAWATAIVMVMILLSLSVRLSRCRTVIFNPYCDNASLFKLSCENVTVNNIYGLSYTVILLIVSIGSVSLTYLRITIVCLSTKSKMLNSRALQTCTTHLAVYVITVLSGFINVILHRIPELTEKRKVVSFLLHVIPPALNPVIYGLQIKAVRQKIQVIFTRNTVTGKRLIT